LKLKTQIQDLALRRRKKRGGRLWATATRAALWAATIWAPIYAQKRRPVEVPAPKLRTENYVYESGIRTVQLFKGDNELSYPIYEIHNPVPLTLSFDELGNQTSRFFVTFKPCDAHWNPADLFVTEYLEGIDYEAIMDIQPSAGTRVDYVNYRHRFPHPGTRFKLSGNYLLVVYRDHDPDKLVLTRRFVVTENILAVEPDLGFTPDVSQRFSVQSVNFYLHPGRFFLPDPVRDLKVTILQNFRWEKARTQLTPLYIRPDRLEYRFDASNDFRGGNEFRMFDLRTVMRRTGQMQHVDFYDTVTRVWLKRDKPRARAGYYTEPDFNGNFVVGVREWPNARFQADYVDVMFVLQQPPVPQDVYVYGALTDWRLDPQFRMEYHDGHYIAKLRLKQGVYNYLYVLSDGKTIDEEYIEGSYNETENYYTILVYYAGPTDRNHRLLAVKHVNFYD
jgi:hypothetical protein